MLKKLLLFSVMVLGAHAAVAAPTLLSATVPVNITSETAAAAKNIALDSARRQVLRETLGNYSDREQLNAAIKSAKAADLANLISSSQIDGEQQSDTSYSANITMIVDKGAAQSWLNQNNIRSWLPDASGGATSLIVINLRNKMYDWIELNRIARGENVELNTRAISGNQMTVALPDSTRRMLLTAARAAGWQSSVEGDVTHLWK